MEEFSAGSPAYAVLRETRVSRLRLAVPTRAIPIDGELCVYTGDGDRDEYLAGIFGGAEVEASWPGTPRPAVLDEIAGPSVVAPASPQCAQGTRARGPGALGGPAHASEWIRLMVEAETSIEWLHIGALDGLAELRPFLDPPDGFGEDNVHVLGGNRRLVEGLRLGWRTPRS